MPRTQNPGHLTKQLSMQVFGAFAADLVQHLEKGLTDEECKANQNWLGEIAAASAALPDGDMWGKQIYQRCDAVVEEYKNWNSPQGTPAIRDKYHHALRTRLISCREHIAAEPRFWRRRQT